MKQSSTIHASVLMILLFCLSPARATHSPSTKVHALGPFISLTAQSMDSGIQDRLEFFRNGKKCFIRKAATGRQPAQSTSSIRIDCPEISAIEKRLSTAIIENKRPSSTAQECVPAYEAVYKGKIHVGCLNGIDPVSRTLATEYFIWSSL